MSDTTIVPATQVTRTVRNDWNRADDADGVNAVWVEYQGDNGVSARAQNYGGSIWHGDRRLFQVEGQKSLNPFSGPHTIGWFAFVESIPVRPTWVAPCNDFIRDVEYVAAATGLPIETLHDILQTARELTELGVAISTSPGNPRRGAAAGWDIASPAAFPMGDD